MKINDFLRLDYPKDWYDSLNQHVNGKQLVTYNVVPDSEVWKMIQSRFIEAKPSANATIT
jgi:hypothetical protein